MPHSPTLLILGASARAAAGSALRAGWRPRAVDLFADRDLAALCPAERIDDYPRGFLSALAAARADAWLYTGGLENHPRLLDRLAARLPLWGNCGRPLRRARNPWRIAQALRAAGFHAPRLAAPRSPAPPFSSELKHRPARWLRKPLRSGGGLGILAAPAAPAGRGAYWQEWIEGRSGSALYLAARGDSHLLGVTRQLHGPRWHAGPFGYAGSIGPLAPGETEFSQTHWAELEGIGRLLAREFELVGLLGVDFIADHRGIWPVEVNPRYTASVEILERGRGEGLLEYHRRACLGREAAVPAPAGSEEVRPPLHGKAIVYARRGIVAPEVLPAWLTGLDSHGFPRAADLPPPGARIEPGGPVLTVFASGDSASTLEEELARRAARAWDDLAKMQTSA